MTDYGPTYQEASPDLALRNLLSRGGLIPIDVKHDFLTCRPITIDVVPDDDGDFAIQGIASRNLAGQVLVTAQIGDRVVLRDVDLAAFNLSHLLPYELGTISKGQPLWVTLDPVDTQSILAPASFTLWGRYQELEPSAGSIEFDKTMSVQIDLTDEDKGEINFARGQLRPLLVALRLLRQHEIEIEDEGLRALMDRVAPLL